MGMCTTVDDPIKSGQTLQQTTTHSCMKECRRGRSLATTCSEGILIVEIYDSES